MSTSQRLLIYIDTMHTTLNTVTHLHCIGIGGIGLSALARMFLLKRIPVSGSDITASKVTDELKALGAQISFGQQESTIEETVDLVLYTIAIPKDNPELVDARARGITTMTYPEALGFISKSYTTIAIAGTHGKTTTTAMTAEALIAAGLDPTVIVGSFLKKAASNFISGKSNLFLVEACEYRESFLHLQPQILVITNIEEDHLDYYKDIDDIIKAFNRIALRVPENGYIVADLNDKNVAKALEGVRVVIHNYKELVGGVEISVPGMHNRENAAAALAVASILEADTEKVRSALKLFSGTWRRFEKKGETKGGILVYDDYAHHPTEIMSTLKAAREFFIDKNIVVVFQPHLFSRTKLLLGEFALSFKNADKVILLPIYPAREIDDGTISSNTLYQKMKGVHSNVSLAKDNEDALRLIREATERYQQEYVLLTMGAGDAYKAGELLLEDSRL
jgi:UDP-N-acetylmuramate--alanine ligase